MKDEVVSSRSLPHPSLSPLLRLVNMVVLKEKEKV
jgi:hypothetical protein